MLRELHLNRIGPTPTADITFAERLNVLTGDNGLGKTFLLDVAGRIQQMGDTSGRIEFAAIQTKSAYAD